jgi:hypothetical protein
VRALSETALLWPLIESKGCPHRFKEQDSDRKEFPGTVGNDFGEVEMQFLSIKAGW